MQYLEVDVLGPKNKPFSAKKTFKASRFTPGCTVTVFCFSLKSKIAVKCFETSTTIPGPTHCPAREVPAVRGMRLVLFSLAKRMRS